MPILMVIPIFMVIMSLLSHYLISRWLNIIHVLVFNLVGLLTYVAYDKFLIVVEFVFNVIVCCMELDLK